MQVALIWVLFVLITVFVVLRASARISLDNRRYAMRVGDG